MALSLPQMKAVMAIARGRTDTQAIEDAGTSRTTFYSWRKQKQFTEAIQVFTEQELHRTAELAGNSCDVAMAYQDENYIREQLKPLLEEYVKLVSSVVERVADEEIDNISPRQVPQLMQSLGGLIDTYRTSNDRLSGLEGLIDELAKIEKARTKSVVSIAHAPDSSAA